MAPRNEIQALRVVERRSRCRIVGEPLLGLAIPLVQIAVPDLLLARIGKVLVRLIHRKQPAFLVGTARGGYCPVPKKMENPVYKILTESAFREAEPNGHLAGSADDLRDGFIHFSNSHRLGGTLAKHYAGRDGLVPIALDSARLEPHLRGEPSRGGALFPRLYAPLDLAAVLWAERLRVGAAA